MVEVVVEEVLTGTDSHLGITVEDGVVSGVTLGGDLEEDLGVVREVGAGAKETVLGVSIAMTTTKGVDSENHSAIVEGVGEISVINSVTSSRIEETVLGVPSRRKTRKLSLTNRQMYVCAY